MFTEDTLQLDRTELNVELNDLRRRIANGGEYSKEELATAIKFFMKDANSAQAASATKKTTKKKSSKKAVAVDLTDLMDLPIE